MLKYLIILAMAAGTNLYASAPDTVWTKTFGGIVGEEGRSVQQTSDGGYIVLGWTSSFGAGENDVYLIKTDANGDTLWTNTFGGINGENSRSVQQTSDDGYIITGWTYSFGAGSPTFDDVYLIKTDVNGDTMWTKTFGGTNYDYGYSVQQTSDGGYIIAGGAQSFGVGGDVYLIKTDANGDTIWTKIFGGTNYDYGCSVQQTSDAGYIIAGRTESFGAGGIDIYLIKTDINGDTMWTKTFGGPGDEEGYSVRQTLDTGYIIVGYTESFGAGAKDVYLIKTDVNGDTVWTKTFGGYSNERGSSVRQTLDTGYIITGETFSFGAGSYDVYFIKTNSNGDTVWTKAIGGTDDDYGYSVQQTSDAGYIVAGRTESFGTGPVDVYLIKLGPEIAGVEEEEEELINPANGVILSHTTPSFFHNQIILKFKNLSSFPLQLQLYNIAGIPVFSRDFLTNSSCITIESDEIKRLPVGIYFLLLSSPDTHSEKLKLIKL